MRLRWHSGLTPQQRDAGMVVLATVAVWLAVNAAVEPSDHISTGAGAALGLLVGAVQFWRRRWPVAVLLVSAALVVGYMSEYPAIGLVFPLLVPYFGAAVTGHVRPAVVLAVALAGTSMSWRIIPEAEAPMPVIVGELQGLVVVGLALAVGEASWQRRRYADEVRVRLTRAAEDAAREADRRATGQRLAIAADLHDVLAHHLVVVGLQLRLAEETVTTDPIACRSAIAAALEGNDEALRETTTAVRLLRGSTDGAGAPEVSTPRPPMPGLDELHGLTAAAIAAGIDLDVRVDVAHPVPAATGLVAYRICQEAMTNTIRHARAGRATLRVSDAGQEVHVSFRDDGTAAPAPASTATATATGHGLAGMAERAAGLGGRLCAGPTRGGGFLVEAWLPGVALPGVALPSVALPTAAVPDSASSSAVPPGAAPTPGAPTPAASARAASCSAVPPEAVR